MSSLFHDLLLAKSLCMKLLLVLGTSRKYSPVSAWYRLPLSPMWLQYTDWWGVYEDIIGSKLIFVYRCNNAFNHFRYDIVLIYTLSPKTCDYNVEMAKRRPTANFFHHLQPSHLVFSLPDVIMKFRRYHTEREHEIGLDLQDGGEVEYRKFLIFNQNFPVSWNQFSRYCHIHRGTQRDYGYNNLSNIVPLRHDSRRPWITFHDHFNYPL